MSDTASWFGEHFGLSGEAAIPLLAALVLWFAFIRIINGSPGNRNPIEFWHFFSAYNERARKEYGDINSLGMMAGIVGALFVIVWTTYKANAVDPWALGVCLVYLGGVKAFAAWLRTVAAKKYGAADAELPPAPAAPAQHEVTRTTSDKLTTTEPAK